MQKRFSALFLFLVLILVLVHPGRGSTLDRPSPLAGQRSLRSGPSRPARRSPPEGCLSSYLYRSAAAYSPKMEMLTGWLGKLPVTTLSLVAGQTEKGYSLQGAATFTEDKGEEGGFDALVDSPLPGQLVFVPDQGGNYALINRWVAFVLLAVEKDIILFGFSPEDLAAAREALQNGERRMKIDHVLPQGSFFRVHDNGMVASQLQAESKGTLKAPEGTLAGEIGFETTDRGFDLSVFTNFAKVFGVAEADGVLHPIPVEDRVLLGEGKTWFSAIGQSFLKKGHFQALRDSATAGDQDSVEAVKLLDAAEG